MRPTDITAQPSILLLHLEFALFGKSEVEATNPTTVKSSINIEFCHKYKEQYEEKVTLCIVVVFLQSNQI